jgi:hypothetical protein
MSTQHLILGKLTDFVTGRTIVDTIDERARQKIARFLVEQKGYSKDDIETRRTLPLTLDGDKGAVKVDFVIRLDDKAFAIVMFGPGSVVTRERSTLAVARLVEQYVVRRSFCRRDKRRGSGNPGNEIRRRYSPGA